MKIQVFEVARGFGNWRENDKKLPDQGKLTAVAILHGISLISVISSLNLGHSLENLVLKIGHKNLFLRIKHSSNSRVKNVLALRFRLGISIWIKNNPKHF